MWATEIGDTLQALWGTSRYVPLQLTNGGTLVSATGLPVGHILMTTWMPTLGEYHVEVTDADPLVLIAAETLERLVTEAAPQYGATVTLEAGHIVLRVGEGDNQVTYRIVDYDLQRDAYLAVWPD
jgi:hypothetical protein